MLLTLRNRGLSRYWLAQRLRGLASPSTIYRWLSGGGQVLSGVAYEAMQALRMPLGDLRWATVRLPDGRIKVCREGDQDFRNGTFRQLFGTQQEADRSYSERSEYRDPTRRGQVLSRRGLDGSSPLNRIHIQPDLQGREARAAKKPRKPRQKRA